MDLCCSWQEHSLFSPGFCDSEHRIENHKTIHTGVLQPSLWDKASKNKTVHDPRQMIVCEVATLFLFNRKQQTTDRAQEWPSTANRCEGNQPLARANPRDPGRQLAPGPWWWHVGHSALMRPASQKNLLMFTMQGYWDWARKPAQDKAHTLKELNMFWEEEPLWFLMKEALILYTTNHQLMLTI